MRKSEVAAYPVGSAEYVIRHARWQRSRGRKPSEPFRDQKNPLKALSLALTHAFRHKVQRHYNDPRLTFSALEMAELAPGVVAVRDSMDEVDALFDMNRWKFTSPEIWETAPGTILGSIREEMLAERIGLLEGISSAPPANTVCKMMSMARHQLTSNAAVQWHSAPQKI